MTYARMKLQLCDSLGKGMGSGGLYVYTPYKYKNILDNHVNLNVNGSMSDTEGDGAGVKI